MLLGSYALKMGPTLSLVDKHKTNVRIGTRSMGPPRHVGESAKPLSPFLASRFLGLLFWWAKVFCGRLSMAHTRGPRCSDIAAMRSLITTEGPPHMACAACDDSGDDSLL